MLTIALGVAILGGTALVVMVLKDRTYAPSAPYTPRDQPDRDVAVVYYSRSGHSEGVAREIARTFNAPIARIEADYPRNFVGQAKAIKDARAETLPAIHVESLDLAPARRIFMVSRRPGCSAPQLHYGPMWSRLTSRVSTWCSS